MKTFLISIAMLAAGFGLAALVFSGSADSGGVGTAAEQLYTCGMHPEIISAEPGYCPICGMKLTPKKEGGQTAGAVVVEASVRQNLGIKTAAAVRQELSKTVRLFGKVAYAEPNLYDVNLKINGWIEKLYVDRDGQMVAAGEPLLEGAVRLGVY